MQINTWNLRMLCFMLFLHVILSENTRYVITFHEDNPCQRVDDMPACATMIKCYSTRLVIDTQLCDQPITDMYSWTEYAFGNETVALVERDITITPLLDVYAAVDQEGMVHGTVDSNWENRWWPMSASPGLRADEIWCYTNGSDATVLAILDSGIPAEATSLFHSIVEGYDFISDDSLSNDGDGRDTDWRDPGDAVAACPGTDSWHGLQVAFLAAGDMPEFHGVATGASILPIRVLGACQTGHSSDVADAIVWASGGLIDNVPTNPNPATVISMSFAGVGACPSYVQSAVVLAISRGVILLAAAGNTLLL
jgi:hypothetical protein